MGLKKYVIRGLGEFFDGLVVHCDEDEHAIVTSPGSPSNGQNINVFRIEQPSQLFETFSLPVNHGLTIDPRCLEKYIEPTDDFLTDNPFGTYKAEGKVERDGVTIFWGLYTRAITISIKNLDKTLLSQNVFDSIAITKVKRYIDMIVDVEDYDILDAVFDLKEICDG